MTTAHPRPREPRPIGNQGLPDGVVSMLMGRIEALEKRLTDDVGVLDQRTADIEDRVTLLEARDRSRGTGRRALDDVAMNMLTFMEGHWPMKFTALTLADNLGEGYDNERLGARLRSLLERGLVVAHKREGRTGLWSALPPEQRKATPDA